MARDPELILLDPEIIRRAREILFYDLCGELKDVSEAYLDQVVYDVLEAALEVAAMRESPLYKARQLRRCDVCGIVLERSGDEMHPNDRPEAGRCWFCRGER